jgi:type IV pilus assembly protein PilM
VRKLNLFAKKQPSCGLDLGGKWAKFVCLGSSRQGAKLQKMGRLVWRPNDWDKHADAAQRIRNLFSSMEVKNKVIVTSMAGHAVIIKRVALTKNKAKSVDENIHKEAKQYIPFDINDVYLDYQQTGPGKEEGTENVILVASKKKMVQELQEVLHKADLGVSIVDVDAFALSNCFEFNYPEFTGEPCYLLDIGSQQSIFCVYWQNQPIFIREVGFGGQQVTDRLANTLNINKSDAEKLKLNGPASLEEELRVEASREMDEVFKSWAGELERLIDFYRNSVEEAKTAERLFLAGGGSLLNGLRSAFAKQLDFEVQYLDPWKKIDKDFQSFDKNYLQSVGPQFAVAVGLALRELI